MTDQTVDVELIKQQAVEAAQQALISKLQGDKKEFSWEERGEEAPKTYKELFNEFDRKVKPLSPDDIDARVEAKLLEREAKRQEEEKQKSAEQLKSMEDRHRAFSNEWRELIAEKKITAPAPSIMEKVDKGEKLTKEEMEDEGIKAFRKLSELSAGKKSAKVTYYEDYNQEPAGASAPVLGGRPASSQNDSQELDYKRDVAPLRKRIFGF